MLFSAHGGRLQVGDTRARCFHNFCLKRFSGSRGAWLVGKRPKSGTRGCGAKHVGSIMHLFVGTAAAHGTLAAFGG